MNTNKSPLSHGDSVAPALRPADSECGTARVVRIERVPAGSASTKDIRQGRRHEAPRAAEKHFDFLALPGELRNLIYRLALVTSDPLLDREHKTSCAWWTRRSPDSTPYAVVGWGYQKLKGCRCWAREGLALLLVNRQVHHEAATIFWGENHFTFCGGSSLISTGTDLRRQYRSLISRATVYNEKGDISWLIRDPSPPTLRFWEVLFECKGLQDLEMTAYRNFSHARRRKVDAAAAAAGMTSRLPERDPIAWGRLTEELPSLRIFVWLLPMLPFPMRLGPLPQPLLPAYCGARRYRWIAMRFDLAEMPPAADLAQHACFAHLLDRAYIVRLYELIVEVQPRYEEQRHRRSPHHMPPGEAARSPVSTSTSTSWTLKTLLMPEWGPPPVRLRATG